MRMLPPTTTVFSEVERADVCDVAAMVAPQYWRTANLGWLRECYARVYGMSEVAYRQTDDGVKIYAAIPVSTLESVLDELGTPDILTWGVWLAITRSSAIAQAPPTDDTWQVLAAAASAA